MADRTQAFLTSPRYRWSILARVLISLLLGIGLFAGMTFLACDRELAVSYAKDIATLSRLQDQLPGIVIFMAAVQALAVGGITLLCTLIWTHAVSGPLVRVSQALAALSKGHSLEDVRFRKTDQLHGLADALREVGAAYQARREASRYLLAQADRLIEECAALTVQGKSMPALLTRRLTALRSVYEEMAKSAHRERRG